jgi:hemerythrin-like domain-containing protein
MSELWATVRQPLRRWCETGCTETVDEATRAAIDRFRSLYAGHINTEEGLAFPAARSRMDTSELADMGRQMQARRQG